MRIKNVIIPIAIANPSLPNNFRATSVAIAVAATFTRLFPRLTLAIMRLGFFFNFRSDAEPFTLSFTICSILDILVPTKATSKPLKNPESPIKTTRTGISTSNCIAKPLIILFYWNNACASFIVVTTTFSDYYN